MLVLFNAIGGKSEDQVLTQIRVLLSVNAISIIDIFHTGYCADVLSGIIRVCAGLSGLLCQVVLNSFVRSAGSFYSFYTEVGVVHVRICDFQRRQINILSGKAVDIFVDGFDLGICQVEVGRKPVAGDRVGRVEASGRNRVTQIDPEKVIASEFHVIHILHQVSIISVIRNPVPVFCRDGRTVFYSLSVRYVMIVDAGAVIEDCVEVDSLQQRDILICSC